MRRVRVERIFYFCFSLVTHQKHSHFINDHTLHLKKHSFREKISCKTLDNWKVSCYNADMKQEIKTETPYRKTSILIETTPDGKIQTKVQNCSFELLLRMTIPLIVEKAKDILSIAEKPKTADTPILTSAQRDSLKKYMYDVMNIAFSNALTAFAPEIEARPDLTADALLKAQNDILEEEMRKAGFEAPNQEVKSEDTDNGGES